MLRSHRVIAIESRSERATYYGSLLACLKYANDVNRFPYRVPFVVQGPDGRRLTIEQQRKILPRILARIEEAKQ